MNPRIYKKQAKIAIELLRSFGQYEGLYAVHEEGGVESPPFRRARWLRLSKHVRRSWDKIHGVPERLHPSFDGEWDCFTSRGDWLNFHYWEFVVRLDYDYESPLPQMTTRQKRERLSRSMIALGWCWRGGRAMRIAA